MNKQQVSLKISGEEVAVKIVSAKLEEIFPLHIKSKEFPNDKETGIHLFMTVIAELDLKTLLEDPSK